MIHLNTHGLVDPDVHAAATPDELAALKRFRDVQIAKARAEHWMRYYAPRKHARERGAA